MFKEGEYTIELYKDDRGNEPVVVWLKSIRDIVIELRIENRIKRLELGNFGDYKSVDGALFELRLNFGSGYRVYFAKKSNVIVLLLCGGDKKTQKRDIVKAKRYWNNYKIFNKKDDKIKKI